MRVNTVCTHLASWNESAVSVALCRQGLLGNLYRIFHSDHPVELENTAWVPVLLSRSGWQTQQSQKQSPPPNTWACLPAGAVKLGSLPSASHSGTNGYQGCVGASIRKQRAQDGWQLHISRVMEEHRVHCHFCSYSGGGAKQIICLLQERTLQSDAMEVTTVILQAIIWWPQNPTILVYSSQVAT